MRGVHIGYRTNSETRYINPIKVNLKTFELSSIDKIIYLVDTPGMGDSNGPEVDISCQ